MPEMNRDGKSDWTQDRVRVIGRWNGPFRRTNPRTGKRGMRYFTARVKMAATDNEPIEMILHASPREKESLSIIVSVEQRTHSTGEKFLSAYPAEHQAGPANIVYETVER